MIIYRCIFLEIYLYLNRVLKFNYFYLKIHLEIILLNQTEMEHIVFILPSLEQELFIYFSWKNLYLLVV